jgi:dolichol-phosphate mannosyltransferase
MKADSIDVVIPVFNEKDNILPLVEKLTDTLSGAFSKVTLIFIDDGSTDGTEKEFDKIITTSDTLEAKYFRFSKNFGKDLAIKCGIDHCESDLCAVIDGDFQHPPDKILTAYEKIVAGYNIVHILKKEYNVGTVYRQFGSRLLNLVIRFFSGMPIHLTDYKLLDKKAVQSIKQFKESCYFSAGVIDHIGLKTTLIYYDMGQRKFGKTKFNLYSLFRLAFRSIIAISINPLRISIILGFCISAFSLFYSLFILFEKLFLGQPIAGFTTIAVGMFFLGGIQLFFLGIVGEYVGRTFIEAKRRPQYIIEYQKQI